MEIGSSQEKFDSGVRQPVQQDQSKPAKPKKEKPLDPRLVSLMQSVSNLGFRVRILEEKYVNLRKKNQVTDQNMLESNKRIAVEIRAINADILELNHQLSDLSDEIKLIKAELKEAAKKNDLHLLERYLSYWEPLSFATKSDVELAAQKYSKQKF
ncbi:hypothetical protein D6745_02795 [Candidatus Woesearchaeota archaeon]|nr:MAG: hypothetical protein D6745_02795 [Candidatus Woesearchaeota archaeon]